MEEKEKNDPVIIDPVSAQADTTSNETQSEKKVDQTTSHSGEYKTSGYVVKKINTSTHYRHGLKERPGNSYTVSIDTDSFSSTSAGKKMEISEHTTSIDTDIFLHPQSIQTQKRSVVIDETDVYKEQHANDNKRSGVLRNSTQRNNIQQNNVQRGTVQPGSMRRRELPQTDSSLSLDISSGLSTDVLPSIERQDRLGSGIVTGILGSGGMAKVYKIWNEQLEVYRAVKVLLPTSQKEQLDRFLTEAKITAKLHHPNIAETYSCGEWHGMPVIEMELLEGHTLSHLISTYGVMPVPVTIAIAIPIAIALHYAHAQEITIYGKQYKGIIHRDLKPSNIMVSPMGRVTLMDFGVARPLETGLHTVTVNSIVGTLHYFSPEQISGCQIDHLTDIYSFGAVLYELLCGKNPFPYSNMVQMVQAKTKNYFVRLEDYALPIDNRAASVAQTCLRTDRRERYTHFGEIVAILENILHSFKMGCAEEIVARYLNNPEEVKLEYEQYINAVRSVPKPIDQPVYEDSTYSITFGGENESRYNNNPAIDETKYDSGAVCTKEVYQGKRTENIWPTADKGKGLPSYAVRLRTELLIAVICFIVLLIVGIVMLFASSKSKKNDSGDSAVNVSIEQKTREDILCKYIN